MQWRGYFRAFLTKAVFMRYYKGWQEFNNQPLEAKLPSFEQNGKLSDILYAQQFSKEFLESLFALSDKVRYIAKTKRGSDFLATVLSDKRALLFFVQPSTRTFLSFENACHILGMKTSEIRDASTSSEVKGESTEDMIRTFSSYVDVIITRHFDEGFAELAAWVLNTQANRSIPVINGGSGKDQHPTQALLDIYTLKRAFAKRCGNSIDGKKILMVGDLKRGRTVRSLSRLLTLYNDVEITFASPKEFAMQDDILQFLRSKQITHTITDDFEAAICEADAIYCTRIQDEHDIDGESRKVDTSRFYLLEKHLNSLKENTVILHPFPRRDEIDVAVDKDPRALYWKQARNGMWIRIALLIYLFDREKLIEQYSVD